MIVVTAEEMRRIDTQEERAGPAVAAVVEGYGRRSVLLLVGKGNNGGDAFAAGCELLKAGWHVSAKLLTPLTECGARCRAWGERFFAAGGREGDAGELIVDGLTGLGFTGEAEGKLRHLIEWANSQRKPIVSIDLPSGLDGTKGTGGAIVSATETVTLGLPKIGLFVGRGWDHVGKVTVAQWDLKGTAVAHIPTELAMPPMRRSRHKYEAGYVLGYGGSPGMMGALKLAALGVLKVGAGIVRVFPEGAMPLEVISEEWSEVAWGREMERAQAVFVGPGMGRSRDAKRWLEENLALIPHPTVVDGDALFFMPELSRWPSKTILTPHGGELARFGGDTRDAIVVSKGAPTFIYAPGELPTIIPRGDPGMATAGAGDVLTGIIAGLLAQGMQSAEACRLGVYLHAVAGEVAAAELTSYCVTASSILEHLPSAIRSCTNS